MQFYKERILNAAQLKKLGEHKYSCTSSSILDAWLQPWWCWLVSKTPFWLAPNLITILGLIVNIVTTLILVWYSPDARRDPPAWACALCALGVFIYQSLDAIDGKQARRTGSQSPLGELFDHGCDSISTVFIALGACTSVKLGEYPTWMFFQCFCAMTLFYCAHWQAYVTGTLRMGKVDVTEAQYTIIAIHLVSATLGSSFWSTQIGGSIELRYSLALAALGGSALTVGSLTTAILAGGIGKNGSTVAIPHTSVPCSLAVIGLGLAIQINFVLQFAATFRRRGCGKNGSTVALPMGVNLILASNCVVVLLSLYLVLGYLNVIMKGGVGKNGSTVAGTSILSPVIPFSLVVVPAFIIFQKSESHVYENHPALYIVAFGMVAAKVTNRLVVAHMTKSEMDYYDWSLLGPAMLFLNQYFNNALPEYYVLWLCTIWVCVDLARYCGQICLEICDHLKIKLFRIAPAAAAAKPSPAHAHAHDRNVTSDSEKSESEDSAPLINNNSIS